MSDWSKKVCKQRLVGSWQAGSRGDLDIGQGDREDGMVFKFPFCILPQERITKISLIRPCNTDEIFGH